MIGCGKPLLLDTSHSRGSTPILNPKRLATRGSGQANVRFAEESDSEAELEDDEEWDTAKTIISCYTKKEQQFQ